MKYVLSLFRRSAFAVSLAALASCSSGGSDGPSVSAMQPPAAPSDPQPADPDPQPVAAPSDPQPADPDPQPAAPDPWFVDSAQVRSLTGAASPDFTAEEGLAALDRRVQSANWLLTSDVVGRVADGVFGSSSHEHRQRGSVSCSPAQPCALDVVGTFPSGFTATQDVEYQAVAAHRGIALGKSRNSYETNVSLRPKLGISSDSFGIGPGSPYFRVDEFGYGGWLEHSAFQVNVVDYFRYRSGQRHDRLVRSVSIGDAAQTPLTVSGTWSGVMVGFDPGETTAQGHVIQGDADITVTIDDRSAAVSDYVDVAFTNIYDLDTGTGRDDMTWDDLDLVGGRFSSGAPPSDPRLNRRDPFAAPPSINWIYGRIYGPNHEEVGGVFQRNGIIGAFGASRQ